MRNSHELACLTSSFCFAVFSITATAVKISPNFNDTIGLKRQKNCCTRWCRTCLCRTCLCRTLISAVHSLTCSAKATTTTTTYWRFCKFSFSFFFCSYELFAPILNGIIVKFLIAVWSYHKFRSDICINSVLAQKAVTKTLLKISFAVRSSCSSWRY